MVRYETWLQEPSLNAYRRGHSPRDGFGRAGLWVGGVFTGASGKRYHGMRGFDDIQQGISHAYNFHELIDGNLDDFTPNLYPELGMGTLEAYAYSEDSRGVHLAGENIQFDIRADGFDWGDADGRFAVRSQNVGSVCAFLVPQQDGINLPVLEPSQMGRASGVINDDPVEGFTFLDQSFSEPGLIYFQLPLIRRLEKQWSMWFVEYESGDTDAGFVWKGRAGTEFSPAHVIENGVSSIPAEAKTFTTYTERGVVRKTRLEADGVVVELEQDTVSDWPSHTFGRAVSTSRGLPISRSWNFVEWMPDNVEESIDRYAAGEITVEDVKKHGLTIEDEKVILPEVLSKQ